MNNGLKALLIAASTLITCMIVGLGFMMAREAKKIGNQVVEELQQYRVAIEEQDLTKYDGATVYGNDIVNVMKQELKATKGGLRIVVNEETKQFVYEAEEDIEKAQEYESIWYIMPTAEYVGKVLRNENDVIMELNFTKKREEKGNE